MTLSWLGVVLSSIIVCGACSSETTSFRTTDKVDESPRIGPPAAIYEIIFDEEPVAEVHVWSNGGYVDTRDSPMTHVGFEIRNVSERALWFSGDSLQLTAFDAAATALRGQLTSLRPTGPSEIVISPGKTVILGSYFAIPIRPRGVDHMQVQWSIHAGELKSSQATSFVRTDDSGVTESPRMADNRPAQS